MAYDFDTLWDVIVECGIATDEELGLAVALLGRSMNVLNDVIYVRTGHSDINSFLGDDDDE